LWCSPVAPSDGASLALLTELVTHLVLEHGFEPAISLTMITERAVACIVSIAYDRAVSGEDQRAMACYRSLVQQLEQQGYYSYRLSIGMMSAMGEQGAYADMMRNIKHSLDPAGILAPGRYVPAERHTPSVRETSGPLAECGAPALRSWSRAAGS
jgi:4-cresol dehydrogenase (hydroxylating)